MKKFSLLAIFAGFLAATTGCQTPAYTSEQRFNQIGRNWRFEYEQINDDLDHLFLLRPTGHLSEWDLQ